MNIRTTCFILFFILSPVLAQPNYTSPVAVVADPIDQYLFIATKDGREIIAYDTWLDSFWSMDLSFPNDLTGITLSSDRKKLYVVTAGAQGSMYVVDRETERFLAVVPAGHCPSMPVASTAQPEVFICNQHANLITVVNTESNRVVDTIPTKYQPSCLALTPDSDHLLVAHLSPDMPSTNNPAYCTVAKYDAIDRTLLHEFALPDGSSGVLGMCTSPDGRYAYVTHLVGRYRMPTTQVARGWVWTNVITILDLMNDAVVNTVLLDELDLGAANPWPVCCTEDGKFLCVATAGSEELIVIDRLAMHKRLELADPEGIHHDFGFLNGLREYVALPGKGARSMVVMDRTAYIPEYFSDAVDVVANLGDDPDEAYSVPLSDFAEIDPMQFHTFDLPASNAFLVGNGISLENEGANLGNWNSVNAYARWTFEVPKTGNYSIFMTAAAPKDDGGGTYEITVDGQKVYYPLGDVKTTASWTDYCDYLAAEGFELTAGEHVVELRAKSIAHTNFMNVKKLSVLYSEIEMERVGEILFHDGTVCYQSWLSCSSCHPGARTDGLNWDLGNDGLGGSTRNPKSLMFAHETPPTTITGVRPHAYTSVRAGFQHIEFVTVPESYPIAVDAYLKSLRPVPSPWLEFGELSEAAQRGERLFALNCSSCHLGDYYTISAGTGLMYDVGTGGLMDVPTVIESWRTKPYLNDGRAHTMKEAIAIISEGRQLGLSEQEMEEIAAYTLTIGPKQDESSFYKAWQWVANNASVMPDTMDADGDGVPQIVEYFHGLNPNQANAIPVQELSVSNGMARWRYPARHATDVEAMLQSSTNLVDWADMMSLPKTVGEDFDIPVGTNSPAAYYRVLFQ